MAKGERIKALREQFGMTQDELAEKIGTTKQTVYKYEMGIITNVPSDKIEAMADLFGVSPSYLMGWDDQDQTSGQQNGYYIDPETVEKIHEIYEVPELRIIFDAKRDLSPEDLEFVVKTIGILKGASNDD